MSSHSLQIDILTLFPEMFPGYLDESIIKRAREKEKVTIRVIDLRDYTRDRHRTADGRPYGGGAGMVLKPEPIFAAVADLRSKETRIILLSPRGQIYGQDQARRLAGFRHLIFICGRYEGVDERVRRSLVDEEISIGDYILTGGELAALVVIDSLVRLIPGVLGHPDSSEEESFSAGRLEYPQYTRPEVYRGMKVPRVLLSGDHAAVARWRRKEAFKATWRRRPELVDRYPMTEEEKIWQQEIK